MPPQTEESYTIIIDGRDLLFELKDTLGDEYAKKVDYDYLFGKILEKLDIERSNTEIIYLNTIHSEEMKPETYQSQMKFYNFLKTGLEFTVKLVPFEYREYDGGNFEFFSSEIHTTVLSQLVKSFMKGKNIIMIGHDRRYNEVLTTFGLSRDTYLVSMIDKERRLKYKIANYYKRVYEISKTELMECFQQ